MSAQRAPAPVDDSLALSVWPVLTRERISVPANAMTVASRQALDAPTSRSEPGVEASRVAPGSSWVSASRAIRTNPREPGGVTG